MSEPTIPLHRVPELIERHVSIVQPLVARLHDGTSSPLIETVDRRDVLNERGYRAAETVRDLTEDAFRELEELNACYATPTRAHEVLDALLLDAVFDFGGVSSALRGLAGHPDPCTVAWGLDTMLRRLQGRLESDDVAQAVASLEGGNGVGGGPISQPGAVGHPKSERSQDPEPRRFHHPLAVVVATTPRQYTAAEVRTIVDDALGPLVGYLELFDQLDADDVTDEKRAAFAALEHLLARAWDILNELHGYQGYEEPGFDPIVPLELVHVLRAALPGLRRVEDPEAFARTADAIQYVVRQLCRQVWKVAAA